MEKLMELLNEKNSCLEKFFELNEKEMIRINEGNFDQLVPFYQGRETLLELISIIDKKIDKLNIETESPEQISSFHRKNLLENFAYRRDLVTKILAQDLDILSVIEGTKSQIIKELNQQRSTQRVLRGYRSGLNENILDEKI